MTQRYFIRIAYRGAEFHGWQRQPNACSVQQTLEDALSLLCRREIEIVGAGRTDTGVNARTMFAHVDLPLYVVPNERFISSLNKLAGPDISIYEFIKVPDDAHARFDATSRTYKYFVTQEKSPFLYPLSWFSPSALDYDAMNSAAEILLETSDFTSFSKLHTDVKTNICDVTCAEWVKKGNLFVFTITADRFLRNMVRAVVGTLVDVGRGKLSKDDFRRIINRKDRCAAGTSMPGHALFLWDIEYPGYLRIGDRSSPGII